MKLLYPLFVLLGFTYAITPVTSQGRGRGGRRPAPNNFRRNGAITKSGTGCPNGSIGSYVSPDNTTFTLIFQSFNVFAGPGINRQDGIKACSIGVPLEYQDGFQYNVYTQTNRGFVQLDEGVHGMMRTSFSSQHNSASTSVTQNFTGPLTEDYSVSNAVPVAAGKTWSKCGHAEGMRVNTLLEVNNAQNQDGSGSITTDSEDGQLTFEMGLEWQQCTA
jgi:Domain of unknown function (DUF4360)